MPEIEPRAAETVKGLEHLSDQWVSVLRWLTEGRVEHVVVGRAGEAIRGDLAAQGVLAIVPAPYHRNLDRLAGALGGVHARLRTVEEKEIAPVRLSAATLSGGEHWTFRLQGAYDLDIDIVAPERYSELLYEAGKFELEPGLSVEVASPEYLAGRTSSMPTREEPEIRVSRGPAVPQSSN